jgi:ketosteroid isomerase-like protein
VALYEPKATFVLDSGEVITGQSAIREVAQGYIAMKPKFTQEVKALLNGDEDLALTSSTWNVSGIDTDGKPFTANGKSMEVVRRQADGTWRFVIDNPHGGE